MGDFNYGEEEHLKMYIDFSNGLDSCEFIQQGNDDDGLIHFEYSELHKILIDLVKFAEMEKELNEPLEKLYKALREFHGENHPINHGPIGRLRK